MRVKTTVQNCNKQSFLHGALILTVGIIIVKVIGALFKVPLSWVITEDGMGYFNTAYNFYSPIYSLSTAGFPIAIARMVSENYTRKRFRDIRQIHKVSIPIFVITGILGFLLMAVGAPFYVYAIGNTNALPAMYCLAPAILFSCLMAIYRGYYEGLRNMYPTAISEIIEAACKLALGLSAAYWIMKSAVEEFYRTGTVYGFVVRSETYAKSLALPYAAAGAIAGVTVGSLLGYLFLFIRHKRRGDGITQQELASSPRPQSVSKTVKYLIKTAVPIGAGALAVNIAGFVDATFLQTRLRYVMQNNAQVILEMYQGMIPEINLQENTVPNFLFGCFSLALTLFMVVPSITQAFGISALPNVTAAWTRGVKQEIKRSMEMVIRITAIFSIPAGMGMAVLAQPITHLIFGNRDSSPITARILFLMGIGAIFASLSTPVNSMLQAVGRTDLPVKLLAVGLIIKITLNYFLVGIPEINVLGAGAGTLACYVFLTIFALFFLCRVTHVVPNFLSIFGKPLVSSGISIAVAWAIQDWAKGVMQERSATILSLCACVFFYLFFLFLTKAICREDILMLPNGQKIAKILEKSHWIR